MREAVLHHVERLRLGLRMPQRLIRKDSCGGESVELRQTPQAAPDTALRPPLKEHRTVFADRDEHEDLLDVRRDARRPRRRDFVLPSGAARKAAARSGGKTSQSGLRRTHTVAPRSMIACVYAATSISRSAALGKLPQALGRHTRRRRTGHSKEACQHSLGIAIENREWLTAAQSEDRACRGAPDARQRNELGKLRGNSLPNSSRMRCAARMQVARACVIPQSRPQMQDVIDRGFSQRRDVREAGR